MEVDNQRQSARPHAPAPACAECLEAVAAPLVSRRGEPLCAACAETYYAACSACGVLVAREEALSRDGASLCDGCDARAAGVPPEEVPDESEVGRLVAEYVRLHAEEKRVKDRLDEIKDRLKVAAAVRPRASNAVTLRGEDGAVKCSYRETWKCDEERVAALESALDAERFGALFQRSVKYAPVKESLEQLLAADSAADAELRRVVGAAVERTEQATLTVVRPARAAEEKLS